VCSARLIAAVEKLHFVHVVDRFDLIFFRSVRLEFSPTANGQKLRDKWPRNIIMFCKNEGIIGSRAIGFSLRNISNRFPARSLRPIDYCSLCVLASISTPTQLFRETHTHCLEIIFFSLSSFRNFSEQVSACCPDSVG